MQATDVLTTLYSHNLWANLRLLERCVELADEQLDATIPGTYGSIRATLRHIVLSEQSYLLRISTGQPLNRPQNATPLSMAEMLELARTTGLGLIEWSSKVQDGDTVQINRQGTPHDVPKAIIFTQAINHATEHRAQIMATLTQIGIEPPDLQAWSYYGERNA